MRMKKYIFVTMTATLLLLVSTEIKATIFLDLTDATSYARNNITAVVPTGNINTSELIGIYEFNQVGLGDENPFWSTCLSPLGTLGWNQYSYEKLTFTQANDGQYPSAWAYSGSDYYGVQNAAYLWRTHYDDIVSGVTGGSTEAKNRGAGLALAMLEALYDSTAYGAVASGNGNFYETGNSWGDESVNGTVEYYYKQYLDTLDAFDTEYDIYNGYVLRGKPLIDNANEQDLILIGEPVPEPSTIIAGVLLMLPFGVSAVRILRKNRMD